MENDLGKRYDFKESEPRIYSLWEQSGYFSPDAAPEEAVPYVILLPPPNITGSLHMGHALNASLSDVLIRYHRMRGRKTVWFPGIDHAGIATQNVVERQLKKEGKTRWDLGREAFIERVWQWKEQYGSIILEQFKRLGVSCDWSRLRFTMDKAYADEVKKAFIHYHQRGWIYRGTRVINWCPRCRTSLSDLEVEHEEAQETLWYISYPLKEKEGTITVATVRPETMLGDAAVAVHPDDTRYKDLVGLHAILPIVGREIPILADSAIEKDFGTGAVKVTPAHDILDAEIGERHHLPLYQVIGEDGKMTKEAGADYQGLSVKDAREKVLARLKELGVLTKEETYTHNLAVCSRCHHILEPIPSKQWFLKMEELARAALDAVDRKQVRILPENFAKPYRDWLEHIRDWCISRQIWWGHRLPVYFCANDKEESSFVVAAEPPSKCPSCGSCTMRQSEDVLDTWFSSALWPFAALSKEDLARFYPSHVLITARDIINLWVARMIFSGIEFRGKVPFPEVLIHATVLTKEGKRMSKSKGTGIDPMRYIEEYGADATRFGILWQATGLQDIRWDETAIQAGKKFVTKLWNIARFVQARAADGGDIDNLEQEDLEIIAAMRKAKREVATHIEEYQFAKALQTAYNFVWHQFADRYLEQVKQRNDPAARYTLHEVLRGCLVMLHPFIPFVTEEIHQRLIGGTPLIATSWENKVQ